MPSNAYMKPEKDRGQALLNAYGAFLSDHDLEVETQRAISDIYWYIKEESDIDFEALVAKSISDADNWQELEPEE